MASTAELEAEILADLEENPDAYTAPVNDVITIDPETRTINIPASETLFGTEQEMNVERKYFKCPKIVGDNIDLSKHQIYITYVTAKDNTGTFLPEEEPGLYYCEDMAVDGDYITFSWLLSGNVLNNHGFIAFAVSAKHMDGEVLKTRWKTKPAVGTVLLTVPDGEAIVERYPDIITQLLDKMNAVEEIATPEAMQNYVDAYFGRNPVQPVQLDSTLTDPEKAAPANVVGELRGDLIEDTNKLWVDFQYTKGNYLNKYGGLIDMDTSYVTDYIPVKYGQKIQVSGYAGNEVALYAFYSGTQANTMMSIYAPVEYKHYTQIVEVPKGANYIVACSFTDTDRFFIRIICDYDDLIEAIEKVNNAELLLDYKPKYGNHLKKPFDFRNKTSCWFGDSITEGVTSPNLEVTNENYPTLFASYVGASTVYNRAVSGSCIADSDNQYSILNRILNYSYGAKDFTFVAGGTNDYSTGKQVGTFGDTTADTFYGALHLICEHLKTNDNFVNSTVIFITPINQNKNRDNPDAIASINTYRNAIYEVATSYGFNVVDGSQIGFPIERGGFADELCTDGVHPTQKGHEYYARALCGILM